VASRIAEATLALAGVPVFRDGNVLALPSATLEVAQACSGLRSLVSLLAIGVLLAWLTDGGLVRRGTIVALAVPIAIVMNGLRIAATGVACETIGPRAASGAWHETTGWLTFVGSVALLALCQAGIERCSADASRSSSIFVAERETSVMEREALAERSLT
jgi:exosortase